MKKNKNNHGVSEILYYNDTVNIIYEACTACYNNTKDIYKNISLEQNVNLMIRLFYNLI